MARLLGFWALPATVTRVVIDGSNGASPNADSRVEIDRKPEVSDSRGGP
jgi:hypothetical protein